jgi:hypothetical protein
MRKLLTLWIALAAIVGISASSFGGSMTLMGVGKAPGGAPPAPTFTNFASGSNASCPFATSCTISSVTVASGFNVVAAEIGNSGTGVSTINRVDLCGTTLTLQSATASAASAGSSVGLAYGTVTGGACTIVIFSSLAGSIPTASAAVGLLSNLSSTTPGTGCTGALQPDGAGSGYACSSGITVSAGGFGVAAIGYNSNTTLTSANLTIGSQSNAALTSAGIAYSTTSNTPAFQGAGFVYGAIVAAPWN